MRIGSQYLLLFVSSFVATAGAVTDTFAEPATGCAPGTRCLAVQGTGAPGPGTFTAQCSGTFPDFIVPAAMMPAGGPWFKLSQAYPTAVPANDAPWLKINFKPSVKNANEYLYALRDYAFEGMIDVDFRPQDNAVRPWFHMPLMNFGGGRREPTHGLTAERSVVGPELGVKPGVTIHNYAVGFYNAAGSVPIGQVWKTSTPDLSKSRFPEGAMTFKILFSDVTADQFSGPDLLAGAPQWTISTPTGMKTVRLMQMDVAAVDSRSPVGWVFGTFGFDKSATDVSPWKRLRPVGLSWGNDFGYTPANQKAGKKLKETIISDQIPAYAKAHLGWAGRTNGPVDNPISGCLSCHGTAQFPVAAALAPFAASCDTTAKKMYWFRNIPGSQPFGAVNATTCMPASLTPAPVTLDFSLQMQVAVQNILQTHDTNPCAAPAPPSAGVAPAAAPAATAPLPAALEDAARVRR